MEKKALYDLLGRRIAQARGAMTQQQLAEKVDMSRASIANIERGQQSVSVFNLYAIAEAVGMADPADLLPMREGAASNLVEVKASFGEINSQDRYKVNELISRVSISANRGIKR